MVYKLDLWTFLPQWLHWYDYSPVCIFFMWNEMWTTRTALNTMTELVWLLTIVYSLMSYKVGFCSKAFFLQWLHWYCFSPVCILSCFSICDFIPKLFSQWLHWYGFVSVCIISCNTRLDFWTKLCHNGRIGVASHQCVFSHALQNQIS